MNDIDLNEWQVHIDIESDVADTFLAKKFLPVETPEINVYFYDLESHLKSEISKYSAAVGCVAWLTSVPILKSLANLSRLSIVIQKEDFLRPDSSDYSMPFLKSLYEALPGGPGNPLTSGGDWGGIFYHINTGCGWSASPVRWVGCHNKDRLPAWPRMHHKFLVLGDFEHGFNPKAIWTGSFNFTKNSTKSMENAVLIKTPEIVQAYFEEWQRVFLVSESIPGYAWSAKWEPEDFRIGT